jgi:peptidyl-tRNA hydrolase, PTH1 family
MIHISAIIGLGNPGPRFYATRHNIGFRVLDALAHQYNANFRLQGNAEIASITVNQHPILLIKPQTFMNASGEVAPFLKKKGIGADQILVVHDELELPFGTIKSRKGGSAKGHNGLRSLIAAFGPDFMRVRVGIGRPAERDQVPDYVLSPFSEPASDVERMIEQVAQAIVDTLMRTRSES